MMIYWKGNEHSYMGTLNITILNKVDWSLIQQQQQKQQQQQQQQHQWIGLFLWLVVS